MNFQGETSRRESVRRTEYTDSEVMQVVDSIRAAKHSENHVNGQISHKLDFRQALTEVFYLIRLLKCVSLVKRWLRTIKYM